jgi:hypothetical protein
MDIRLEGILTERMVLVRLDCWRKLETSFGWVHEIERYESNELMIWSAT